MSQSKKIIQDYRSLAISVKKYVSGQLDNLDSTSSFTGLDDTPTGYNSGYYLISNESGIEYQHFTGLAGKLLNYGFQTGVGTVYFTGLKDTPNEYAIGEYLKSNDNGLEYIDSNTLAQELPVIPDVYDSLSLVPDPNEHDGHLIQIGCELYISCNGQWVKIETNLNIDPVATPELPGCVKTVTDYAEYSAYKENFVTENLLDAFELGSTQDNLLQSLTLDACVFTNDEIHSAKIVETDRPWGIFAEPTTVNLTAQSGIDSGFIFERWGSVPSVFIENPRQKETKALIDKDVSITAYFRDPTIPAGSLYGEYSIAFTTDYDSAEVWDYNDGVWSQRGGTLKSFSWSAGGWIDMNQRSDVVIWRGCMFEWIGGSWHKTIIDTRLGRWSGKTNIDGSVVALDGRTAPSKPYTPSVFDRNSEGGYDKRPNWQHLGNNGYHIFLSADGNRLLTANNEAYGPVYLSTYDPVSQTWYNAPLEGAGSTVWLDCWSINDNFSYAIAKTSSKSPDPGISTVWKLNESSNTFEIDSTINTSAGDLTPYYVRHAISEDGNTAALGKWPALKNLSRFTNIYKKNGSTWTTLTTIPSESNGSPFDVSLSADGKAVALASYGGPTSIRVYKINENGSYVKILDTNRGRLSYDVCLR
jgi:hypothetical protein